MKRGIASGGCSVSYVRSRLWRLPNLWWMVARAIVIATSLKFMPVFAAVQETQQNRPYAVRARPGESLRQALNAATSITEQGRPFHGYTRWNVRWNFWWQVDASGRCTITRVSTKLQTEVQLPQLIEATPDQRAAFERYVSALTRHEEGHVQLGRDAARAIDTGIAGLAPAPDCTTLERNANTFGERLIREYTARQKQYDATTAHGVNQGVTLDAEQPATLRPSAPSR